MAIVVSHFQVDEARPLQGSLAKMAASKGDLVHVSGRVGEVIVHDSDDVLMTYKIKFDDGVADWFPFSAVAENQEEVCTGAESLDKLCSDVASKLAVVGSWERQVSSTSTTRSPSLSSHSDVEDRSANQRPYETLGTDVPTDDRENEQKCMGMEMHENEFVGANVSGEFHCSFCRQLFDTDRALSLHCKFMHDNANESTLKDVGYSLIYEFAEHREVAA